MQDFRSLDVWKAAHDLALSIYKTTNGFPTDERFGLTPQLRRSALSVASNIAEGANRASDRDFARFTALAIGSVTEVEYQVLLARDLGYLNREDSGLLNEKAASVRKMLIRLRQRLLDSARR